MFIGHRIYYYMQRVVFTRTVYHAVVELTLVGSNTADVKALVQLIVSTTLTHSIAMGPSTSFSCHWDTHVRVAWYHLRGQLANRTTCVHQTS